MDAPSIVLENLGLPPGYHFDPDDKELVAYHLVPRLLGRSLPVDGAILEDDPLSAPPWELLERHGVDAEAEDADAFFFAAAQAKDGKGARQKRTCAGGGTWDGQRKLADGKRLRVPDFGIEVAWRKSSLNFREDGAEGSTGWVMHEYAVTAPPELARSPLRVYRIRNSGHGRCAMKRKRGTQDYSGSEDAGGAARTRNRTAVAVETDALFVDEWLTASQYQSTNSSSSSVVLDHSDDNLAADGADVGAGSAVAVATPSDQGFSSVMDGSSPVSEVPESNDNQDDFMFLLDELTDLGPLPELDPLPDWFP